MQLPSQRIGLTAVDSGFNVFMSDSDGHDLSKEFMDECVSIREDRSLWYTPIKFYVASGVLGMLHAEQLIVYVDGGVLFILSSIPSFDGDDHMNASLGEDGERMVSRLFNGVQRGVFSLGVMPEGTDFARYANEYYARSGIVTDGQINSEQALMFTGQWDSMYHGNIYTVGGALYEIYAVDPSISSAIRYVRGDATLQYEGREVLLVGGVPEIMPIGYHANSFGHMFRVWTPNDINGYPRALEIMDREWLPTDLFDLDLEEMAEAYALHAEALRRTDPTENLDSALYGGVEEAPPVIDDADGGYDHLVDLPGVDSTDESAAT